MVNIIGKTFLGALYYVFGVHIICSIILVVSSCISHILNKIATGINTELKFNIMNSNFSIQTCRFWGYIVLYLLFKPHERPQLILCTLFFLIAYIIFFLLWLAYKRIQGWKIIELSSNIQYHKAEFVVISISIVAMLFIAFIIYYIHN